MPRCAPHAIVTAAMRIHHLDCGTMCPLSARLINGRGAWFGPATMVCHCLLIETERSGLVLVDTGLGLADIADPERRLGGPFTAVTRPVRDPARAAVRQIERLGFSPRDVRHVIVTHLDLDHAGGLPDFPDAHVHVLDREVAAALEPATLNERNRYRPCHFAHGPRWVRHTAAGEQWMGFDAVRALPDVPPEVLLVPLGGHTRGHCGVAVRTEHDGWLLHAGDAYFFHGEIDPARPRSTPGLAAFQRLVAIDNAERMRNQARLRELVRTRGGEVRVFSAHDPVELSQHTATS